MVTIIVIVHFVIKRHRGRQCHLVHLDTHIVVRGLVTVVLGTEGDQHGRRKEGESHLRMEWSPRAIEIRHLLRPEEGCLLNDFIKRRTAITIVPRLVRTQCLWRKRIINDPSHRRRGGEWRLQRSLHGRPEEATVIQLLLHGRDPIRMSHLLIEAVAGLDLDRATGRGIGELCAVSCQSWCC